MHTLTNSEDPDERSHNATFHLGLYHLLGQKQSSERERERNTIFFVKSQPVTPRYVQWTIPSLLYQTRRKIRHCTEGESNIHLERAVDGAPSQILTFKFWPQYPQVPPLGHDPGNRMKILF